MQWKVKKNNKLKVNSYKEHLSVDDVVANILINRNIDIYTANMILNAPEKLLKETTKIPGVELVAEEIIKQRSLNKRFYVFADYDVDGLTSGHIMTSFLKSIGADTIQYIPERSEGYGLNRPFCEALAGMKGKAVVITVDNGITAQDQVRLLADLDIPAIITDHHEPNSEQWPEGYPVCDPWYKPNGEGKELSGAGVAWMVCREVEDMLHLSHKATDELVAYAALGTIADVMPMDSKNMAIVNLGLNKINNGDCKPMNTMMDSLGYDKFNSRSIAMKAAPLLNSCGRMGNVSLAKKFFSEQDSAELHDIFTDITKTDSDRKNLAKKATEEACQKDYTNLGVCIFDASEYPIGMSGLIASRLADQFNKPAIVYNGESASCRSINGVDLKAILQREIAEGTVLNVAGHAGACGAHIIPEEIELLEAGITEFMESLPEAQEEEPTLMIDTEAVFTDITDKINCIPYDKNTCPPPVLLFKGISVKQSSPFKKDHLVLKCTDKNGVTFTVVNWEGNGGTAIYDSIGNPDKIDLVATVESVGFPDRTLGRRATDLTLNIIDMRKAK